jgi:hypothetical protein|tara:strand:- start:2497 stop:2745 length:249 start_codon:yes stop_codon:yes gene_type:complete
MDKQTPQGDLSWYIKWISTGFIITALLLRSAEVFIPFDLAFTLAGSMGWLAVGILWHDRSLIILNAVCGTIVATGLLRQLII